MSIEIKKKICKKGSSKTNFFIGCGKLDYLEWGLCYECKKKFLLTTDEGQELIIKSSKKMYVTKINPMSKKRKIESRTYTKERKKFLEENTICFIDGCNKIADTIEHTMGRGINYLNIDTWKPCCLEHNLELETNSELSKKYQLSKIHGGKKI